MGVRRQLPQTTGRRQDEFRIGFWVLATLLANFVDGQKAAAGSQRGTSKMRSQMADTWGPCAWAPPLRRGTEAGVVI